MNPETKSIKPVNNNRFSHGNEGGCQGHSHGSSEDGENNVQSEIVQIINCENCSEELGVVVEKERMNLDFVSRPWLIQLLLALVLA